MSNIVRFFPDKPNIPYLKYLSKNSANVFCGQFCTIAPDELADLILASSCTPLVVPVMKWREEISLDGGLIDNMPVSALDENPKGRTLILLTRVYPPDRIPDIEGRIYVQPSRDVPVGKWDYTNPRGLQAAFNLGRRDAQEFVKRYKRR